ncbi:hypothetical protein [uncultured Sulfitobacter sp.]|uniref:hypothetical protein n=1 Tax=uncultured Sulfitobacter sp. TaxID=191468 RepID=UPI0026262AFF|nr:hypothetical protein [uncultured Sulfitobacter sp.]
MSIFAIEPEILQGTSWVQRTDLNEGSQADARQHFHQPDDRINHLRKLNWSSEKIAVAGFSKRQSNSLGFGRIHRVPPPPPFVPPAAGTLNKDRSPLTTVIDSDEEPRSRFTPFERQELQQFETVRETHCLPNTREPSWSS